MWAPGVDPDWLDTAGYCAIAARSLANHPARPLQTLDWGAADPGEKLVWSDRHAALAAGVATWNRSTSGAVTIDRAVSTYTQSAGGLTDNAWRDITTSATVERILRELRFAMERQWIDTRCVLVDDGTPIHPLVPHATPRRVKASLIAHYRNLEFKGFTEREREFVDRLQVGRDPDYPTRLIVYYPPDLANPLIQLDIQVGFSLQFASAA
jgi:phage tail sheath gpL-like